LPIAIQKRFSEKPAVGAPIIYDGVMQRVQASALGCVLAQLCRRLDTPFDLHRGDDVPVKIRLLADASGGTVWEREYRHAGHAPVVVRSTKRVDDSGGLLECVGGGIGMRLAVFEANRALHFLSLYYVWRIGRRTIRLPAWLTPGTAHVVHADLGDGTFRFTMTIRHRLFGRLFQQEGTFRQRLHCPPTIESISAARAISSGAQS